MKEATGELNMTVITLVAIAAIGAVFYFVVWPMVQTALVSQTCRTTYGPDYTAKEYTGSLAPGKKHGTCYVVSNSTKDTGSQAEVKKWECCPNQK